MLLSASLSAGVKSELANHQFGEPEEEIRIIIKKENMWKLRTLHGQDKSYSQQEGEALVLTDAERDVGVGEVAGGGERDEAVEAQAERLHLVAPRVHLLDDVAEALGSRLLRVADVSAAGGGRRRRVARRVVHAVRQLPEVPLALALQRVRRRGRQLRRRQRGRGKAPQRQQAPPPLPPAGHGCSSPSDDRPAGAYAEGSAKGTVAGRSSVTAGVCLGARAR